ncbi:hypothetical protein Cni_G17562 [Canna indica]|uniref:BHLH domain-containing protein n=1 Tax=Canna indica TaxID=4628 RepID=A0AAQ3KHX1_9LILI|nr:hypothetical protein Cni_G17562 [Canna indica]
MENQIQVPYHTIHGYGVDASASGAAFDPTQPWCLPSIHSISSAQQQFSNTNLDQEFQHSDHLPPFASPLYGDMCSRILTGMRFPSAGVLSASSSESVQGLAAAGSMGLNRFLRAQGSASSSLLFGTIHAELGKLSTQEIMDAKALAASKSHSEAERRRRERINGHLAKLRSMLPNTTKTDKASLLAEVIQRVKELKRQKSEIAEESPLPTESDELAVESTFDEHGKFIVKATLCCDDRPDLFPDLTNALRAQRLRIIKAEITTIGGRVKNVLDITEEDDLDEDDRRHLVTAIHEALKAVVEQTAKNDVASAKRQRITSLASIVERSSI